MDLSTSAQLPVKIVAGDSQARLIFDPMRREILRLLSRRVHTAKDLSEIICLTPPSVGHHLKALVKGELISIVREEPESHGIMQKWYQAKAQAFVVDMERLSTSLRRYFMPANMERARSVAACFSLFRGDVTPSTSNLENLAHQICRSLCRSSLNYDGEVEDDPERVVHRLYVDALQHVVG